MFRKLFNTVTHTALNRPTYVQKQTQLFNAVNKRTFSGKATPPPQGGYSFGSLALLGAGTAGMVFLMLKGRAMAHQKNASQYGME